jgi:C4-dicarboxylate-specific signal transduction histidine kinase
LYRYNREFKKDLDKDRALRAAIRQVGKPIVFTTLTISIGFFILIFSSFKPTADFGILMVITMFSALAGDLIILPALMRHVELVTAWDLMKLMPTPGAMPAGIAHELNQPLNAIKMGSDFLRMMISRQANIKYEHINQVAKEISTQVDRASEIIKRLSVFGQKPDFALERVDINEAIKDVIAVVGHQLSLDDIETKLDLDKTLPSVWGHINRWGQVVYNLMINAGDAINEKKGTTDDTGHHIIRVRTYQEDNKIVMTVSDTGIGIPAANIRRIREPFFTTKGIGQGKGLGLSISYEIVKDFGGRIDIHSNEYEGTTLKITLPAARAARS